MNNEIVPMRNTYELRQGILNLCKEFSDNSVMAEIGSYAGESTKLFLDSGKIKMLYAIDPWKSGYDDTDLASLSDFSLVEKTFDENVKDYKNVVKFKMTFEEGFNLLPELDVIYIDGNHTYEAVLNDIKLALKKIKKDGIICGHDYYINSIYSQNVKNAFISIFETTPQKIFCDSSWMITYNFYK